MAATNTKTVYIVDDDPDDRQIILDAFIENNSTLDYVFIENGEDLMEQLRSGPSQDLPSLILLDLNMPGMYGLQALKEIKTNKDFCHIPTIILTTSALLKDRTCSYSLGANCFLQKPRSFGDLVLLVGAMLTLWFPPFAYNKEENTVSSIPLH
jgi:CheY-like chemotaxis protein